MLTAWTGLILLALFLIELATLLNLRDWLSWHILVGVLLVPPALLKTASTSWRIAGYYGGRRPYREAGPPPMPLRVLGPLVVLFTLAVLGSGLTLIALGPSESRRELVPTPMLPVTVLNLHKGAFVVWAGVTGLHTLGRLAPAFHILTAPGDVPGRRLRGAAIVATLLVAVVAATVVLGWSDSWLVGRPDPW